MNRIANDTWFRDEPVALRAHTAPRPVAPERTADLTRIIRHVLRNPDSNSPLSRAIRSAFAATTPPAAATASEDVQSRIEQVALRMDRLLSQRAIAGAAQRETVRD
jgi:hypothetical protein